MHQMVILSLATAVVRAELERISIRDPAWPVYSVAQAAKVSWARCVRKFSVG